MQDDAAISCPKGTYAVCYRELSSIVTLVLLRTIGIDNACGIIDGINKVISQSRDTNWKYCIYADKGTVSSTDAETKFKEFVRFRKWLNSTRDYPCFVAVVFDPQMSKNSRIQIERVFNESGINFKSFDSQDEAIAWLKQAPAHMVE